MKNNVILPILKVVSAILVMVLICVVALSINT